MAVPRSIKSTNNAHFQRQKTQTPRYSNFLVDGEWMNGVAVETAFVILHSGTVRGYRIFERVFGRTTIRKRGISSKNSTSDGGTDSIRRRCTKTSSSRASKTSLFTFRTSVVTIYGIVRLFVAPGDAPARVIADAIPGES